MKTFGSRLKNTRENAGLNQTQLAKAANVSKMTISSLESEKNKAPSPENLFNISDALRCNPRWLATGKGIREDPEGIHSNVMSIPSERIAMMMEELSEARRQEVLRIVEEMIKLEDKLKKAITP